jgi:hypothetical protein
MECRPNLSLERRSEDIPPHSPIPALTEHFVMKRAINLWTGPRHPTYNSLVQRIRSYKNNWPADGKPSPTALSEAGFYYTGKRTSKNSTYIIRSTRRTTHKETFLITGSCDRTVCFHCSGGLQDWLSSDKPMQEHATFYPLCVFVRYIKGSAYIQECRNQRPQANAEQCSLL